MATPAAQVQVNVGDHAPGGQAKNPYLPSNPTPGTQAAQPIAVSAEGYKFYDQTTDSKLLYLQDISMLLYDVQFVKTEGEPDRNSPIAGYTMIQKDKDAAHVVDYEGFKTVLGLVLLYTNRAISTSKTDESFKLDDFAVNSTMAIMRMIVARRKSWHFSNFSLLRPIGLAIWQNIYHVETRSQSSGGKRFIDLLFHPSMWFESSPNPEQNERLLRW